MKVLERIALVLFSIIMMVIAIVSCLVLFNVIELKSIYTFIEEGIKDEVVRRVILGAAIVSIILAIKSLFFPSRIKKKAEIKTGILLENKDGRLLISKDTIENLINSVVKSFDDAVDVQTKINLDMDNKITVYVSLLVKEDSVIKELSSNMQTKIKETINRNTGLEINQVNINIKDIENKKNQDKTNNQTKIKINNVQINKDQTKEVNEQQTIENKDNRVIEIAENNSNMSTNTENDSNVEQKVIE